MKSVAKQQPFFSAYPLKVLKEAAEAANDTHLQNHLKAVLAEPAKIKTNFRVSPMVNPYRITLSNLPTPRPALSTAIEPEGKEWFNHYE